jgi:hypothetical protein
MAYKPFDLSGKVALVTGGNGGIGLGMAEALAQAGADVIIWGTNEGKNAKALEALQSHGTRVEARRVDVSNEQQVVEEMARAAEDLRPDRQRGRQRRHRRRRALLLRVRHRAVPARAGGEPGRRVLDAARSGQAHGRARQRGDKGGSLIGVASTAAIEGAARNQAYAAPRAGSCPC